MTLRQLFAVRFTELEKLINRIINIVNVVNK